MDCIVIVDSIVIMDIIFAKVASTNIKTVAIMEVVCFMHRDFQDSCCYFIMVIN